MKIKFFSNYDRSDNLLKRFKDNYIIYDDQLTFTIGDDYDFAVVFNRTDERIKTTAGIITVVQEPSWSPAHHCQDFLKGSDYLIIHDPKLFEERYDINLGGEIIESPSFMFYQDHVNHHFFDTKDPVKKTKKLSIIVSYLYKPEGNYRKRIGLLSKILDSDLDIDIYGRRLEIADRRFKGWLEYKYNGLLPYEYSIAIENSNEKNYITEKFVDCVLCDTVPIYNGAPNINDVYDERYFKTINLDSPTIVDDIRQIIALPSTHSTINKDIYRHELNLYTKLKEIILD